MKEYASLFDLMQAFPDERTCVEHLEKLRWPTGIVCASCGVVGEIYRLTRGFNYKCSACGKTFSVRKGTIFEESRLPLRKWFAASWLITANRKGISSLQLSREIGVTQKTAWFMLNRLPGSGGGNGIDWWPYRRPRRRTGGSRQNLHRRQGKEQARQQTAGRGTVGKQVVMGARERNGKVRARPIANTGKSEVQDFILENVAEGSILYTDDHGSYLGLDGYSRESVNHSAGEYVRGIAYTNGMESFWALLKRGYYGTFHHFSVKHLPRYIAEFEARWNMIRLASDRRMDALLESTSGLRLTYERLTA